MADHSIKGTIDCDGTIAEGDMTVESDPPNFFQTRGMTGSNQKRSATITAPPGVYNVTLDIVTDANTGWTGSVSVDGTEKSKSSALTTPANTSFVTRITVP